jgi:hypothetical protein
MVTLLEGLGRRHVRVPARSCLALTLPSNDEMSRESPNSLSRPWLAVSKATSQVEKGTDPHVVTPILRQELNQALNTMAFGSLGSRPR